MLNINNNASQLKRETLVRIAKLQLEGNLADGVHYIPRKMVPQGSQPFHCCIHHDREILRQRIIARLGHSLENYDEEKTLKEYAEEALTRESPTKPMLTVLHEACNACVKTHFLITNACQACLARPCIVNCPKKAISISNGRANIESASCINCGICLNNCPYHAIIKIPVPCEESCPVGAISKDSAGKEKIDYGKCILCGNCMRECPFGAMMDKGQLVDVLGHIIKGKEVVAMYAPSIASQFRASSGQLEKALEKAGFSSVVEVAFGADITATKEAKEFEERIEEHGEKMMTTSCCPAYVSAIKKHVPSLNDCVSNTGTPMHYTAKMVKEKTPHSISVFIGPCLAKRGEGMKDEFVDYVLSVEEIGALFLAKEIDISAMENTVNKVVPTATGRNFATSGGVAKAVIARLKKPERARPFIIDGLDKDGMKKLAEFGKIQAGELPTPDDCPNLIEVMSCQGGCIAGPSVITNLKVAGNQLKKYVEGGMETPKNV